jgi:hypothetical protein
MERFTMKELLVNAILGFVAGVAVGVFLIWLFFFA